MHDAIGCQKTGSHCVHEGSKLRRVPVLKEVRVMPSGGIDPVAFADLRMIKVQIKTKMRTTDRFDQRERIGCARKWHAGMVYLGVQVLKTERNTRTLPELRHLRQRAASQIAPDTTGTGFTGMPVASSPVRTGAVRRQSRRNAC